MKNIVIIDYGVGNLRSVRKAFKRAGGDAMISSDVKDITNADKLVLPGVGHFYEAMKKLKESDLIPLLNEQVLTKKKPILRICLGMQLMTNGSEEGNAEGLKWIDAETKRFQVDLKVPHIGWNTITAGENKLMNDLDGSHEFYFTHSYYVSSVKKEDQPLSTNYGIEFVSAFGSENIFGVQFHPEKSHNSGIKLIENFIKL